jgi:hypothetical protein
MGDVRKVHDPHATIMKTILDAIGLAPTNPNLRIAAQRVGEGSYPAAAEYLESINGAFVEATDGAPGSQGR